MFNDVVNDVSYAGIAMRVEILGQERRRRWRDDEKLAIVMSVGDAGATITEIAHRHDITRQQIYAWRSELKKKGLLSAASNALFIPVDVKAVQMDVADDRERSSGMVELRLSCGRTLRFGSSIDTTALTQLIRAVEAA
ncbi:IS66-like element accessory protein TnpA [Rhizobium hidalgonense]|uniref:IS66-like element accessory protein TnpA n=1 Tax=Rhizobium hidalgonense TaxID=1538159 RepID=UPI001FEBD706|nr:transposase [Rhizobium hidalgonense]